MNARSRAPWEFPYEPLATQTFEDVGLDAIVCTRGPIEVAQVERAIAAAGGFGQGEIVLARAPLYWMRVRLASAVDVAGALARAGIAVRYVTSALLPSAHSAPPLTADRSMRAAPTDWRAREPRRDVVDPPTASRWFLGDIGLAVDRARCGTGEGSRLAVLDDDFGDAELVGVEREVPIGVKEICRASPHGTLVAAWAVGTIGPDAFHGVAPSASPRFYGIPKAGTDVVSVPLAIARAVLDGADVVVCATYVEQMWSPLFDDALAVASRLGRKGRGTAVVMPSGRQASSPRDSTHASWSLSLADPASDPRVFCIGPSARGGGWFLWRDRRGRLRPFANRGPSMRWLAPGDDMADPLVPGDRWCHAESSGASAVAAGVVLLVLAANPTLRLRDLDAAISRTTSDIPDGYETTLDAPVADAFDLLPRGTDRDGHNAKHGYGRMNARRACLTVADPITAALVAMGEEGTARAVHDALTCTRPEERPYSRRLGRWIARRLLSDASSAHALRVLLRHLRLLASAPERVRGHGAGSAARQLCLFLRTLAESAPRSVTDELARVMEATALPDFESSLLAVNSALWALPVSIDAEQRMNDSAVVVSA